MAIVTYNTIFNGSPKLLPPGILLFDDAHAGEQYVADSYAVAVSRRDLPELYGELLNILSPGFDKMFLQRLRDDDPGSNIGEHCRLVLPICDEQMASGLDKALTALPQGSSEWFNHSMIRGQLVACLVYVAWDGFDIVAIIFVHGSASGPFLTQFAAGSVPPSDSDLLAGEVKEPPDAVMPSTSGPMCRLLSWLPATRGRTSG